jgi:hypothetical protein
MIYMNEIESRLLELSLWLTVTSDGKYHAAIAVYSVDENMSEKNLIGTASASHSDKDTACESAYEIVRENWRRWE